MTRMPKLASLAWHRLALIAGLTHLQKALRSDGGERKATFPRVPGFFLARMLPWMHHNGECFPFLLWLLGSSESDHGLFLTLWHPRVGF